MTDDRSEMMSGSFWSRHGSMILGGAVLAVTSMIILPASRLALDILLTINVFAAALLLLLVLSVRRPLELSSFPALMLLGSLFRLALCIAAARLIVAAGDAGTLIRLVGSLAAAGGPSTAGAAVSALIVALVLVIVDLVVISAGTGRAAEVAARFSLDALPGKQLGVDSAVAAGALNDREAQERRGQLEAEADFYAAMDGAARFARGEAIACVAIIALSLAGGIATGLAAGSTGFGQLWASQARLCAGLAVVILVPGLLSCVSAALLVTKGGEGTAPAQDVVTQVHLRPGILWVAAIVLLLLAAAAPVFGTGILGALPPLLVAAAVAAWALWASRHPCPSGGLPPYVSMASGTEPPSAPLAPGIEIRLGLGLVGMIPIDGPDGLLQQASSIRTQIADEIYTSLPSIVVRDADGLRPSQYAFYIRGQEVAGGRLMLSKMLALAGRPPCSPHGSRRRHDISPMWIDSGQASQWRAHGFRLLTPQEALLAHFDATVRKHAVALIDRQSAQALIRSVEATRPAIAAELQRHDVSLGTVRAALAALVEDGIPLSDPVAVLEGILDAAEDGPAPGGVGGAQHFAEAARCRLAPAITALCRSPNGSVYVFTLGPNAEQFVADALTDAPPGALAPLPPGAAESLADQIESVRARLTDPGAEPCIVCSPAARRSVGAGLAEACPGLRVVSWEELLPEAEVQHLGSVDIGPARVALPNASPQPSHGSRQLPAERP